MRTGAAVAKWSAKAQVKNPGTHGCPGLSVTSSRKYEYCWNPMTATSDTKVSFAPKRPTRSDGGTARGGNEQKTNEKTAITPSEMMRGWPVVGSLPIGRSRSDRPIDPDSAHREPVLVSLGFARGGPLSGRWVEHCLRPATVGGIAPNGNLGTPDNTAEKRSRHDPAAPVHDLGHGYTPGAGGAGLSVSTRRHSSHISSEAVRRWRWRSIASLSSSQSEQSCIVALHVPAERIASPPAL